MALVLRAAESPRDRCLLMGECVTEDVLDRVLEWILAQPGVVHSRLYRIEDEQWEP